MAVKRGWTCSPWSAKEAPPILEYLLLLPSGPGDLVQKGAATNVMSKMGGDIFTSATGQTKE